MSSVPTVLDLALPSIAALQPYQPGKPISELERELGLSGIVKLASNENPLGVSPTVAAEIVKASATVSLYPDGNGFGLKAALACFYDIDTLQITLGNGSNDVLELIARAFVSPSDEVLFSEHAFAVYPLVTQAIGATAVISPAKDYGHDLAAMAARITAKTKAIFIANPNNPTGTYLAADVLVDFIADVPRQTIIVVDEAYVEYGDEGKASIAWLAQYPNLIITRTFSKAYGLAGLRVGYALSHPDVADVLNRIRQPFNVNNIALAAAEAALADQDYIAQSKINNAVGMGKMIRALTDLKLESIPSHGNFITIDVQQSGAVVYDALLRKGVIVRPIGNYGLPNHIRVSIGTQAENQTFIAALTDIL